MRRRSYCFFFRFLAFPIGRSGDSLPVVSVGPIPAVGDLLARVRPRRVIEGISAVLMPFDRDGRPDFAGLARQIERAAAAGLTPAVNMDTGWVHVLDEAQRIEALETARRVMGRARFVAGAYVEDGTGPMRERYRRATEAIVTRGGTPILFPCTELQSASGASIVALFREMAAGTPGILAFELGEDFVPFGRIFERDTICGLLDTEGVLGLKHSSLRRGLEWERLALRDARRPEFKVYTGNDLAIDMVMYGSDYLLGLSAFAPEAFALRDRHWREGDGRFYELNDRLQYLGAFAFRAPTPAYRHSAAQFLKVTGHLAHDAPPAGAPRRPDSDVAVLAEIARGLQALIEGQ
jgi:dihydrodipicolinate synthase/N-acetylneuraminate lyase